MEITQELEEFVSYAQYQQQFSNVIEKYREILKDPSFEMESLTAEHKNLVETILKNFSHSK